MCGILGSVNLHFEDKHLDSLKHRGPDDSGIEKIIIDNNQIIFGHRRLSIVDLSEAGHQPMISNCNNYALIFNGEIYNHNELRDKLPRNIVFNGHSDTETILTYFIEFGIDSICDLNGIFALGFLDIKKKMLHLARDPFGVKPLYYSYQPQTNQFIFSSEIRPIKLLLDHCKAVNMDAMATLLRLRFSAAPYTLYQEIEKLKPGHSIRVELTDQIQHAGQFSFVKKIYNTKKHKTKVAFVDDYGEYFEKAVIRQLQSDVPIGIFLSGGIDSAMVASIAQKHTVGKLKSFTVGFDSDYYEDETADAKVTAEILGLEHYVKRITFDDYLSIFKKCVNIIEEPSGTTSIIPMYYLSELASKHVKVVLSGQGADEPLGGYTRYKSMLLNDIMPVYTQSLLKKISGYFDIKNETIKRGINSLNIKDDINRVIASYEIFSSDEIKKLINHEDHLSYQLLDYLYRQNECSLMKDNVDKMMFVDTRFNLSDDLLNYTDKISMHFSLECRVPILDLELIQFIESLPSSRKLNLLHGKIIHKEFAKSILPNHIINRKKKGFKSPTEYWFKKEKDKIKQILLQNNSFFSRYFNLSEVENILDQHQHGFNKEKQIFLLLSLYFLFENLDY
jgi:asparagine synthase (glutamine-hydrolysing)